MPLSKEEREQLRLRAAGLREEVQAVRAEAELALVEKAQEQNDEKLIAEVEKLEADVANAHAMRENIVGNGSVADAMKAMEAASAPVAAPETPVDESGAVESVSLEEVPEEVPVEQPVVESDADKSGLGDPFAEGGSK